MNLKRLAILKILSSSPALILWGDGMEVFHEPAPLGSIQSKYYYSKGEWTMHPPHPHTLSMNSLPQTDEAYWLIGIRRHDRTFRFCTDLAPSPPTYGSTRHSPASRNDQRVFIQAPVITAGSRLRAAIQEPDLEERGG